MTYHLLVYRLESVANTHLAMLGDGCVHIHYEQTNRHVYGTSPYVWVYDEAGNPELLPLLVGRKEGLDPPRHRRILNPCVLSWGTQSCCRCSRVAL